MISNHSRRLARLVDLKLHTIGGCDSVSRFLDCLEALADSLDLDEASGEDMAFHELSYSGDLGSMIVGCYWSLCGGHPGQWSQSNRVLSKIGELYRSGYCGGPEPDSSEEINFDALNQIFEDHA